LYPQSIKILKLKQKGKKCNKNVIIFYVGSTILIVERGQNMFELNDGIIGKISNCQWGDLEG
jgi:hypothetical protein